MQDGAVQMEKLHKIAGIFRTADISVSQFAMDYWPYIHRVSKKLCQCYFAKNSVKHWPNLIIFGRQHGKENDINGHSFAHLTLILLLHYLVKCRSCILDVYNNEFMPGTACRLRKLL